MGASIATLMGCRWALPARAAEPPSDPATGGGREAATEQFPAGLIGSPAQYPSSMMNTMRELTEVAPGVLVTTSRRDRTTSTVVISGGSALLVDPSWEPDELAGLADAIQARGLTVVAGFATHTHHDHLLWHPRFGDAPRWASARTVELAGQRREQLVAALGPDWPPELAELVGRLQVAVGELADTTTEPVMLLEHDGHCPGHTALWLAERRVLIAGDLLSDVELPLPHDPDDLSAYLKGLELLAPYVRQADVLIPGHGSPTDRPVQRLDADRRYLDALIAGIEPPDPRRELPGMDQAHRRNVEIAAGFSRR
jgi:glyoxylase-like metal-dependent hydrolase (beta-lactamase superfamily II)